MLEILISSSVLILVLAILRLVLRDKISARLQYALWLLVLVRLLVPVSFFHSPVSVAEAAAPVTEQADLYANGILLYDVPVISVVPPQARQDAPPFSARHSLSRGEAAGYVWVAGMGVMTAWFLFVNVRLARRLKKNRTQYDYNSVMPVYVAEGIPSPCLFGLFKPSIYLTERAAEDDARARQIIAHELTHYRHGDMIWSLLRSVCLVVWWFNPLVWLAAALSRQDCELACDEGTIKALGEDVRFDYGRTLVGMAKVGSRPSDLLCGATTMTTGKKSLKDRVARIANAPKMSVTVAVIVLIIAAIAVGCTYGSAELPEQEIAFEPAAGSASATDAEDLPAAYSVTIRDPDSGDVLTETPADDGELRELYAVYSALKTLARPLETSDVFSDAEMSYDVRFYDDDTYIGFRMWEDGTFLLFDVKFGGSPMGVYVSPELAERFLDILEEYHDEIADADFMNDVSLGGYDRAYWEEVERELASFAYPADIEVAVADGFDEALPEDDVFGPLTLEDYIYGTDGWKFRYNGEAIMSVSDHYPYAWIKLNDADGRVLWIMNDVDALMIEEADGSVTWATMPDGLDCADMIRHLLPWTRGEYVDPSAGQFADPIVQEAELEEQQRIADELGIYGFRDMEPFFAGAYTVEYPPEDNTDHAPILASDTQMDLFGQCVYFQYGEEPHFMELAYTRYYEDAGHTIIANGDVFQKLKEYYDRSLVIPFTGGLTVNGYDAFFYDNTTLTWYDTERELVFRVWDVNVNEDSIGVSVPLDELIALAESVTAQ